MNYKDYYKTLGVDKNADEKTIKKAYRKLARDYHPDVNPGNQAAEEKFKELNEAYEVLSDPQKRQKYDQFGSQWQQYERAGGNMNDFWSQWANAAGGRRAPRGGAAYTQTLDPETFEELFGGRSGGGFSSFFEALFGGPDGRRQSDGFDFSGFGGARPASPRRRDVEQPVTLTLEEAFHGTTRQLQFGDGRVLTPKIPPGVYTGAKVRLRGKAEPGDIYLVVEVKPHPRFERRGDDLTVSVPVDLYTAVLGGEVQVAAMDRTVSLTIPAGTANGQQIRLRGLGMPQMKNPKQRGDLFAIVEVQLPQNLSESEKELFARLREMRQK